MRILQSCDQVAHLNLSYMNECVDQEVLFLIGEKFQKTLISLELRACNGVDDLGIIGMCERLSSFHDIKLKSEIEKQIQYPNNLNKSNLEFLNLSDLKTIKDSSMKSIAFNLFNKLQDLSIWGSILVTD